MIRLRTWLKTRALLLAALLLCVCLLTSCAGKDAAKETAETAADRSRYLRVVDEEPDTVDFQCTNIHYAVALNVFDRLVETGIRKRDAYCTMPRATRRSYPPWRKAGPFRTTG